MKHLDALELLGQVLADIEELPGNLAERLVAIADASHDRVEAIKVAIREGTR